MTPFHDRAQAGRKLAGLLPPGQTEVVIVGLAGGGMAVAAEVPGYCGRRSTSS